MKNRIIAISPSAITAFAMTSKPKDSDATQLDDLIRGEMSAVCAYD